MSNRNFIKRISSRNEGKYSLEPLHDVKDLRVTVTMTEDGSHYSKGIAKNTIKSVDVMNVNDLYNMKDSDDFLRYFKFEAINFSYLLAHLIMSFYMLLHDK